MKKIFLLLASTLIVSACGVKGDPLPPEKHPEKKQTQEIEALDADGDEDEIKKAE